MAIYQLGQDIPTIAPSAWVADTAQVIGVVTLMDNASVWFGAVVRGDTSTIHIGPEQMAGLEASAQHYVDNALRFKHGLKRIDQP